LTASKTLIARAAIQFSGSFEAQRRIGAIW